jgi:hypothetical protein
VTGHCGQPHPVQADGWCDDPVDEAHYNTHVTLPHPTSTESLWLEVSRTRLARIAPRLGPVF